MYLTVQRVSVAAFSTVGTGIGFTDDGRQVLFAGDWRPMQAIADALERGEHVEAEVPPWAVITILDPYPEED